MQPIKAWKRNWYVAKNYLFLRQQQKPFLSSFKLTYRCNLLCRQCPFRELEEQELSFDQVKNVLDKLYARGSRMVIFEGGEPMLWRDEIYDIHSVVLEAKKRFFAVGITSNGTMPLDMQADVLWISLDGLEKTHNYLRGRDCFRQIIENFRQSRHPKIFAHITVNQVNYREVPDLIRFLTPMVKGITIQFYYPYNQLPDELFLDWPLREALLDEVIELKRTGFPVMNSVTALKALKRNTWRCVDWLLDNADPDGSLTQGCYLKGRGPIACELCGFSPHTEISLAYQGCMQSIWAGMKIFFND